MTRLQATALAQPVSEHLRVPGRVLGSGEVAAYVQHEQFVVAMTARGVPMMPNGITVDAVRLPSIAPGRAVDHAGHILVIGDTTVELAEARSWSPAVSRNTGHPPEDVSRRGRAVLRECGVASSTDPSRLAGSLVGAGMSVGSDSDGKDAVAAALAGVSTRNPAQLVDAATGLIGRGGGLTPEGDDFLGGIAAAHVAFDAVTELRFPPVAELRRRTTALSATLLELAAAGLVVEPLLHVLELDAPAARWRPALRRLLAIGHTTGRAWAMGCGAAALLLGDDGGPAALPEAAGPQA
jgi:uncharacterized protein DUF2877